MAKQRINITISDVILDRINEMAEENGVVRSGFISMILKQYIDAQDVMKLSKKEPADKKEMVDMLESMKQLIAESK